MNIKGTSRAHIDIDKSKYPLKIQFVILLTIISL